MPQVDLVDETFVVAEPGSVAAGVRWNVRGALVGSMEVWLEPYGDGVIVHHYVRCDVAGGRRLSPAATARVRRRRERHAKRVFWALKDELEAGRAAGQPRHPEATG